LRRRIRVHPRIRSCDAGSRSTWTWVFPIRGISGAPTFNLTRNRLCGMVLRATLQDGRFNFMYADAIDLFRFVVEASQRASNVLYSKQPPT
jgi:hypothetical protein